MKISGKALPILGIAVLAALALGFKLLSPLNVTSGTVEKRHLVQEVFGTGTVEARVLVTAGSKITGRVKKLYADQGDTVRKGQLLAVLESDDLEALAMQADDTGRKAVSMEAASRSELARARAESNAAEAALRRSEASLTLARQTFERYEELYKKGMVSRQELDERQAAHEEALRERDTLEAGKTAADAEVGRSGSALEAARHESGAGKASSVYAWAKLEDSFVRASMDGVVVSRDAEEGDAVVPGSPIFRVADPGTVWVKANIDEAQGGGILKGNTAKVYLRTDKDTPLPGSVARVAQESDRLTEEMEVDVSFPLKRKDVLHLGEQAEVYVRGIEKDCLSVPVAAVTVREGKEGVFTVVDKRARFVQVETGVWAHDFVEVKGIEEGGTVILLEGRLVEALRDGARVKPVRSAPRDEKR